MVHLGSQHSFCGGMLRITYVEFAGNITVRADTAHVADWIWIFRKVFLNFLFVLQVAHHRLEGSSSYETVSLEKIRNSTELQWSFFTTKGVLGGTMLVPMLCNMLTCPMRKR